MCVAITEESGMHVLFFFFLIYSNFWEPRVDINLSWMFQRATTAPAFENSLPSRFIPPLLSTDLLYTQLH